MLNTPCAHPLRAPSFSALLLLAAPVIAIAAQNQAVELPAVAVTASRSAVSIEDSPRTITVIGPQQVREYLNAGGIQRLFDEVPGIEYARSGGLGGQLVMRGQNSRSGRTVLAIDGDRHRGRSTLEFNLLDPNAIERIEIIRGPASALYGSDAMSGVVNIITRRANVEKGQDFSLAPRLRAAEWSSNGDMYGLRGELVGGGNGFDVLVGVNQRTANDYDSPSARWTTATTTAGGWTSISAIAPAIRRAGNCPDAIKTSLPVVPAAWGPLQGLTCWKSAKILWSNATCA